jgi:hypothetical protein
MPNFSVLDRALFQFLGVISWMHELYFIRVSNSYSNFLQIQITVHDLYHKRNIKACAREIIIQCPLSHKDHRIFVTQC